jgi:hypothetical protein
MSTAIEPRSRRVDGAILVLIFTAIAYVAAFTYEATYLSYFGIPIEFVDVTLSELLLYGVIALGFIFAAMMFSMFLWEFFLKSLPPALSKIVFIFTLMAVAATAFMLLIGNVQTAMVASAIGGPLLIIGLLFVVPLFRLSHMSSYRRRLMATYAESSPIDSFRLPSFLWLPIPNDVLPLAACTVVSIMLAFASGEFRARTQIEFPVFGPVDPCIVLRVSTEGYLCVAFDPQRRNALDSFRFVDPRGADIHNVKIGRLKPARAPDRRLSEEKAKAAPEKSISPDHPIPAEQQ